MFSFAIESHFDFSHEKNTTHLLVSLSIENVKLNSIIIAFITGKYSNILEMETETRQQKHQQLPIQLSIKMRKLYY